MRGGRSLRLESLAEFLDELREMEEGAGLGSVGLPMVVAVVESRELK